MATTTDASAHSQSPAAIEEDSGDEFDATDSTPQHPTAVAGTASPGARVTVLSATGVNPPVTVKPIDRVSDGARITASTTAIRSKGGMCGGGSKAALTAANERVAAVVADRDLLLKQLSALRAAPVETKRAMATRISTAGATRAQLKHANTHQPSANISTTPTELPKNPAVPTHPQRDTVSDGKEGLKSCNVAGEPNDVAIEVETTVSEHPTSEFGEDSSAVTLRADESRIAAEHSSAEVVALTERLEQIQAESAKERAETDAVIAALRHEMAEKEQSAAAALAAAAAEIAALKSALSTELGDANVQLGEIQQRLDVQTTEHDCAREKLQKHAARCETLEATVGELQSRLKEKDTAVHELHAAAGQREKDLHQQLLDMQTAHDAVVSQRVADLQTLTAVQNEVTSLKESRAEFEEQARLDAEVLVAERFAQEELELHAFHDGQVAGVRKTFFDLHKTERDARSSLKERADAERQRREALEAEIAALKDDVKQKEVVLTKQHGELAKLREASSLPSKKSAKKGAGSNPFGGPQSSPKKKPSSTAAASSKNKRRETELEKEVAQLKASVSASNQALESQREETKKLEATLNAGKVSAAQSATNPFSSAQATATDVTEEKMKLEKEYTEKLRVKDEERRAQFEDAVAKATEVRVAAEVKRKLKELEEAETSSQNNLKRELSKEEQVIENERIAIEKIKTAQAKFDEAKSAYEWLIQTQEEMRVLGDEYVPVGQDVKLKKSELKTALKRALKTPRVYSEATTSRDSNPPNGFDKLFLKFTAKQVIEILYLENPPQGVWLGRDKRGNTGFLRTSEFIIPPEVIRKNLGLLQLE
eukprot:m.147558 g.147558  ORF g.147558 m.147558 type:complete len:828 (+) comp14184_c1_seq4:86-2569(+)